MIKNSKEKLIEQMTKKTRILAKCLKPQSKRVYGIWDRWLIEIAKKFPPIEKKGIDGLSISQLRKLKVEVDKLEKELKL